MVEHSKIEIGPSQYGVKDRTKVFKPQRDVPTLIPIESSNSVKYIMNV